MITENESAKPVKINQWCIMGHSDNNFLILPERTTTHLSGVVTGHPTVPDGSKPVMTSEIVGRRGELVITRGGTIYELGEINADYAKLYPDAKQRFLNSLPQL